MAKASLWLKSKVFEISPGLILVKSPWLSLEIMWNPSLYHSWSNFHWQPTRFLLHPAPFEGEATTIPKGPPRYGCRILQRLFENCQAEQMEGIVHMLLNEVLREYTHWIGLRENLQETIEFPIFLWGFPVDFPLNQSIDTPFFGRFEAPVWIQRSWGTYRDPQKKGWYEHMESNSWKWGWTTGIWAIHKNLVSSGA